MRDSLRRLRLWLHRQSTLVAALEASRDHAAHLREHAYAAATERNELASYVVELRRERDAARATAQAALR